MAFKKKLYRYRPSPEPPLETQATKTRTKRMPCDPRSIEYGVRQCLADKAMGNLSGVWLLAPELLRLGAWELVCGWTGNRPEQVQPRLALQLIHEAALCSTGLRLRRGMNQHIFELANGLPFLATDMAIHDLLAVRTVVDSKRLQMALGKVRLASGDFQGRVLAIDPHRVRSYSKRHMRRHRQDEAGGAGGVGRAEPSTSACTGVSSRVIPCQRTSSPRHAGLEGRERARTRRGRAASTPPAPRFAWARPFARGGEFYELSFMHKKKRSLDVLFAKQRPPALSSPRAVHRLSPPELCRFCLT